MSKIWQKKKNCHVQLFLNPFLQPIYHIMLYYNITRSFGFFYCQAFWLSCSELNKSFYNVIKNTKGLGLSNEASVFFFGPDQHKRSSAFFFIICLFTRRPLLCVLCQRSRQQETPWIFRCKQNQLMNDVLHFSPRFLSLLFLLIFPH